MSDREIGLLGGGSLGQALVRLAQDAGTGVVGWSRSAPSSGARGDADWRLTVAWEPDPAAVVERCRVVCFAVPAHALPELIEAVGAAARGDHVWVHASKGMTAAGQLAHEVMRQRTCVKQIVALGGPFSGLELARRGQSALVAASHFDCAVAALDAALFRPRLRLHRSDDLIGVEVAGALRNAISVADGMAEKLGEGIQSALLARGLVESARLGVALGGQAGTFVGIAGVGDLLAQRDAASSRNFALGQRLGRGEPPAAALAAIAAPVEGAITAAAAASRGRALGVALPLMHGISQVLEQALTPSEMIESVLARDAGLGPSDSLV
ncbi:MAG: NAD(P)-binding domain-containing protein [Deltaproteobacteria bacterium]|nr:NAD(P)-binding domain-containing protein [Deltaproteobacteria bacterium]